MVGADGARPWISLRPTTRVSSLLISACPSPSDSEVSSTNPPQTPVLTNQKPPSPLATGNTPAYAPISNGRSYDEAEAFRPNPGVEKKRLKTLKALAGKMGFQLVLIQTVSIS